MFPHRSFAARSVSAPSPALCLTVWSRDSVAEVNRAGTGLILLQLTKTLSLVICVKKKKKKKACLFIMDLFHLWPTKKKNINQQNLNSVFILRICTADRIFKYSCPSLVKTLWVVLNTITSRILYILYSWLSFRVSSWTVSLCSDALQCSQEA